MAPDHPPSSSHRLVSWPRRPEQLLPRPRPSLGGQAQTTTQTITQTITQTTTQKDAPLLAMHDLLTSSPIECTTLSMPSLPW